MEKIKILIIGAEVPGGVLTYINEYIEWSNLEFFEYHMTTSPNSTQTQEVICSIFKHKLNALYTPISIVKRILTVRKIIKRNNINLIHLHTARAGFLGCIATYGLKIKIIYTGHSWLFEQKKNKMLQLLFSKFEKFICFRSNIVTFLTERDLQLGVNLNLVGIKKCKYIKTQINSLPYTKISLEDSLGLKRRLNIPLDALIIGNCGYLSERKDPITFINIANELIKERDDIYFLWVGDGDIKNKVIQRINHLGIEKKMLITGWKDSKEIPLYLSIMNVFLFTSLLEGVPFTILSAQASNLLTISTDYKGSGVHELIINGDNGLIFPTKDVASGKELIVDILKNNQKQKKLVGNMKEKFINGHSRPQNMSKEFESIYISLFKN